MQLRSTSPVSTLSGLKNQSKIITKLSESLRRGSSRRSDNAIRHVGNVCAWNLLHSVNDLERERLFLENVARVIKRGFKLRVGVGGQPVLFDEIDDFSQADRRDGDLTSGCGSIVYEVSGRNG